MALPSWFQSAVQRRLDQVEAQIESEMRQFRTEEKKTFDAMVAGMDQAPLPELMEWEGKHQYNQALQNERLYLQGMKDGAQLVFALLTDSVADADEEMRGRRKSEPNIR